MFGVRKFLLTSKSLEDSKMALEKSLSSEDFYTSVGIHPSEALDPYSDKNLPKGCNDAYQLFNRDEIRLMV